MEYLLNTLADIFKGIKEATPERIQQTVEAYKVLLISKLYSYGIIFWIASGIFIVCLFAFSFILYNSGKKNIDLDSFNVSSFLFVACGVLGGISFITFLISGVSWITNYPEAMAMQAEPMGTLYIKILERIGTNIR